jgi:hypothetical protein
MEWLLKWKALEKTHLAMLFGFISIQFYILAHPISMKMGKSQHHNMEHAKSFPAAENTDNMYFHEDKTHITDLCYL